MELFAHRGVSGEAPENTLAAFKAAAESGAHGIELDVQLTKDGQIVVIHDETIDRTTNGTGYVKDLTWEQLRTYDAGSWFHPSFKGESIPSLEEVLDVVTAHYDSMIINIELKNDLIDYPQLEEKVLELLNEKGMKEQTIISSFNPASLKKVRELDPDIETGLLFEGIPANILDRIKPLQVNALHCDASFAQSPTGRNVMDMGMPLRVFTINTVEEFQLVKKAGVEVVMTDYPGLFLEHL
ncbi:glycerophosphodiester phosphodiesterase [Rossellomorea sp. YZS02]|uniref:glycerophosphodiester phosphodiesterase n=1 Tax=Rossellomorea sp. YZS02 TaxID=3097358 RepID=UPI002A121ED1|nr:glycerophosphodiester phosphodiesterase [Rossellomorea sp. YZS02]MDX8345793.1 glycerophosphodiester phosphodiesterase [Rossellomorea sp. YZS02]